MLSARDDWADLLDATLSETFLGNVAEKKYWVDLYRRRQEDSSALGTGLADDLAKVVRDLSEFDGDHLVLVLVSVGKNTYFVWLRPDLSHVISCFRAKDKRSTESSAGF